MKTVLIGAGNVATHLGKALAAAGHDILQVCSRTMASAASLAQALGAAATDDPGGLTTDADVYIFAVKDQALEELVGAVSKRLGPVGGGRLASEASGEGREKLLLHTSGSMPLDVFRGKAPHYGVLYPMQTFSKQRDLDFRAIPCFIEYNDAPSRQAIQSLASSITDMTYELSSEERKYLHLSAVWACNFVNHCYGVAHEILSRHHIPFEVMLPLIDETASKVHDLCPRDAQTGPAVRYDDNVIRAHLALLDGQPQLSQLYEQLSLSIHKMSES